MSFLAKPVETSASDLHAQYQSAEEQFEYTAAAIKSEARARAEVVESRLQELEAEKASLVALDARIA